jgi:hypothetical protein
MLGLKKTLGLKHMQAVFKDFRSGASAVASKTVDR